MKITKQEITVRELYNDYINDDENGVYAYSGKLCCRPPFQREYIYKDKQRDAVIETVRKGFPLNTMFWALTVDKHGEESYELMDGQQRTISIMEYVDGAFAINYQYFFNLTKSEQEQILDYKLDIYICDGDEKEKLDWFKVINIAGVKLTDQELLNAAYVGPWVMDAKRYFSKTNCPANTLAGDLMNGAPIRQDYLHTVLGWIADRDGIELEEYMAQHQHDKSAIALWTYFQEVVDWVRYTFPNKRAIMKGVEWGLLYNAHHSHRHNPQDLEDRIIALIADKDVTNQKGIYDYVLSGSEKALNIRAFDERDKMRKYEEQRGICPHCHEHFEYKKMDGDHIVPWAKGGKTEYDNLQMLCIGCNRGNKANPNIIEIED
jgi:hypothetical protein